MKKTKKKSYFAPFLRPLLSAGLRLASATLGRLSPRGRMRLARGLGRFAARFLPYRKKIAIEQIQRAFPQMSAPDIKAMLPLVYAHLIAFGLETFAMTRITPEEAFAAVELPPEGKEVLDRLKATGRGFVIVTAHAGNWEWAAACLRFVMGMEVASAAKPLHDPASERFIQGVRQRWGVQIVSTREDSRRSIATLAKVIREGGIVALVADQDARHSGIFVDFFGVPASTFTGPAWLAHRLDVPLVPFWGRRTPEGKLRYDCDEPIRPDSNADAETEIRRLTEYHVRSLEKIICADPAQYLWIHKRWKTKPKSSSHANS